MRPFRLRVVTAIVLAVLMLGSLANAANADELSAGGFTFGPSGGNVRPTAFPEDPWPGLSQGINSFPEDPWPGLGN